MAIGVSQANCTTPHCRYNHIKVTTADVALSPQQACLECFYPRADVVGSEKELDFHNDSTTKTVVITNNFSQKMSAVWMV